MLGSLFRAVFGTKHERDAKRMRPAVDAINALEPAMQALDDAALRAKTDELRARHGATALEDVFMSVTGRRLDEADAAAEEKTK